MNGSLRNAIEWLELAQDKTKVGALPKKYVINKGWNLEPYPEITGYTIPTFITLYKLFKKLEFKRRAEKMGNFLVKKYSTFRSISREYIFDLGQILIGLVSLYESTHRDKYLNIAIEIGDFLTMAQDSDGVWRKNTFTGTLKNKIKKLFRKHSYTIHSRVSYGLLKLWRETGEKKYKLAAEKNLKWVISNQLPNGYFLMASTLTHKLAYVVRGLIESGLILNNKKLLLSSKLFMDTLSKKIKRNGFLNGDINYKFKDIGPRKYVCLTGNAQFSIIFSKLSKIFQKDKYRFYAQILLIPVRNAQKNIFYLDKEAAGGVSGSWPLNGMYAPNTILPWATKFFIDSLLLLNYRVETF